MNIEKEKTKRGWWLFGAILFAIVCVGTSILYMFTLNMALILIILSALAGAAGCYYKTMGTGKAQYEGISEIGPVVAPNVNTFCIYSKDDMYGHPVAWKVEFVEIQDKTMLLGDRWFFEDLNQWLYVLQNNLDRGEDYMSAFELPDAAYTDPARLAVQLNMGRVNELFQIDPSLMDQLKPWVLFGAVTVIGFFIFLSGG